MKTRLAFSVYHPSFQSMAFFLGLLGTAGGPDLGEFGFHETDSGMLATGGGKTLAQGLAGVLFSTLPLSL